jgi:hypothetical protein
MTFGNTPALAFQEGQVLHGFDGEYSATGAYNLLHGLDSDDAEEMLDRIMALLTGFGDIDIEEEVGRAECYTDAGDIIDDAMATEDQIYQHEDGRLAIIGNAVEGHTFALELERSAEGLAMHRREEIADLVKHVEALREADGDGDDVATLAGLLNDLEEIAIDISVELDRPRHEIHIDCASELASMADLSLDGADLPSWGEHPRYDDAWSYSAGGRYLLYPPDSSSSCASDADNLSTGTSGWRLVDACGDETFFVADSGDVFSDLEGQFGGFVDLGSEDWHVGLKLTWEDRPEGDAWMLRDDLDREIRIDRPADWNPETFGWGR